MADREPVAKAAPDAGGQRAGAQMVTPADAWRRAVEDWLASGDIAAAGPEPRPSLEPDRFRWRPDVDAAQPTRPSRRRALEALPEGGTVLDVGVGGGASSLGLASKASLIIGVDPLEGMLASFEASARAAGVESRAVLGSWPTVAGEVGCADVVVCHHALYGVVEIEPFVRALTAAAGHRVVLELAAHPPLTNLNPLWRRFHGRERTDRLVADEAEAVLASMGLAVEREDIVLPARAQEVTNERVAFVRRRVGVPADRDPEIEQFLQEEVPQEQRVAALWWPGACPPASFGDPTG